MATITLRETQKKYMERKKQTGWKRIQIWKLDEKNKDVRLKIKLSSQIINQSKNEKELMEELTKYNDNNLKEIVW